MDDNVIAPMSSCNVLIDYLFWSFSANLNVTQGGQCSVEGGYRT
jgi:hypothetical protein